MMTMMMMMMNKRQVGAALISQCCHSHCKRVFWCLIVLLIINDTCHIMCALSACSECMHWHVLMSSHFGPLGQKPQPGHVDVVGAIGLQRGTAGCYCMIVIQIIKPIRHLLQHYHVQYISNVMQYISNVM